MQAGDKVKTFFSWVWDEVGCEDPEGHFVVTSHCHGAGSYVVDSAHCRDNHCDANETTCFTTGGITVFDRTWGDADSRDTEGGWGGFKDHGGSAESVFGGSITDRDSQSCDQSLCNCQTIVWDVLMSSGDQLWFSSLRVELNR